MNNVAVERLRAWAKNEVNRFVSGDTSVLPQSAYDAMEVLDELEHGEAPAPVGGMTGKEIITAFESEIKNNPEAYLQSKEPVYQITAGELVTVARKLLSRSNAPQPEAAQPAPTCIYCQCFVDNQPAPMPVAVYFFRQKVGGNWLETDAAFYEHAQHSGYLETRILYALHLPAQPVQPDSEMLLEVIKVVRQYPDFDDATLPLSKMMDEALLGRRPELLDDIDAAMQQSDATTDRGEG